MILPKKGTKGFCLNCKDHVFTLASDIKLYGPISELTFTDEGQGPWNKFDLTQCRKCNEWWYSGGHFFCTMEVPNEGQGKGQSSSDHGEQKKGQGLRQDVDFELP